MKNHQGFITTGIIMAIVAVLAIGGGVAYIATRPSQETLITSQPNTSDQGVQENPNTPPQPIATITDKKTVATNPLPTNNSAQPAPASTTTIQVPLIINGDATSPQQIGPFGCGSYMVLMNRPIPATQGVLNAVYDWMFSHPVSYDDNNYSNIVAAYPQLDYSNVTITNGTAKVYLTGSMAGGPGHCAEPAMAAQIEQAAFQYPSVQRIEVYLNNQLFDWCSISDAPDEGFCANGAMLWAKNK